MFIGFEQKIIGIDCNRKKELFQQDTLSIFYEFIITSYCVLAICELEIYAFDSECKLVWFSGFRDIIEDYDILDEETISIRCDNGDNSLFALKDGTWRGDGTVTG